MFLHVPEKFQSHVGLATTIPGVIYALLFPLPNPEGAWMCPTYSDCLEDAAREGLVFRHMRSLKSPTNLIQGLRFRGDTDRKQPYSLTKSASHFYILQMCSGPDKKNLPNDACCFEQLPFGSCSKYVSAKSP